MNLLITRSFLSNQFIRNILYNYLQDEFLVDDLLADGRLKVTGLEEAQEELVNQLEVRPRGLQSRVVLLRVEVRVVTRRQSAEQVGRYLIIQKL